MTSSLLLLITCFTISFIFHFTSSSSATRSIPLSSESSENQEPRASKRDHLYEFNSVKAVAGGGISRLPHGHGSTGGYPDYSHGGGRGGGAAVPVIIAGAANNNHHQGRSAAVGCNRANNIYWRGVVTLVTAATLASMWKPLLDD